MPGFKDDIIKLANLLGITHEDFSDVGIHAWPSIMKKIEAAFVIKVNSNTHFNYWWDSFKGARYSISFENGLGYTCLDQLIDNQERIWFVACGHDKFWLFEGKVKAIQLIISEHYAFEYYLVSKKYEWLICETDHDILVGLGTIIPKMQKLNPVTK